MTLERELDEAVDEARVVEPRGLPHLRVAARAREPGDGVDLVHVDAVVAFEEEIDARHAGGVDRAEGLDGERLKAGDELGRDWRRNHETRPPFHVLRLVVIPVRRIDDLARERGFGLVVAEHADLDLTRRDAVLDDDLAIMPRRLRDRGGGRGPLPPLADADARAEVRRLHEAREADLLR